MNLGNKIFDLRFPRPKDKELPLKHPVRFEYAYNRAGEILGFVARRTKDGSFWYSAEFKHDLRGNVSQKRVILSDGTSYTTNYLHDFENRLWKILFPGGEESEFLVLEGFVLKRRYQDEEGKTKEINLIYDGDQVLLELDEKGEPIKRYVLGAERDEILWVKKVRQNVEDGEGAGNKGKGKGKGKGKEGERRGYIFYHYDQGGNVVILTDFSGDVVAEYEYSPFGEVLEAQGPEAKKNRFLFAGRYYISEGGVYDLSEGGIYDFRARVLDGRLGRFLEREPLLGERMRFLSMYSYARNNPVNFKDTTGLYFESVKNWAIDTFRNCLYAYLNSVALNGIPCMESRLSWAPAGVGDAFRLLRNVARSFHPLPDNIWMGNGLGVIAKNRFWNQFLPRLKDSMIRMVNEERGRFKRAINRWWIPSSTINRITNEYVFNNIERVIRNLPRRTDIILPSSKKEEMKAGLIGGLLGGGAGAVIAGALSLSTPLFIVATIWGFMIGEVIGKAIYRWLAKEVERIARREADKLQKDLLSLIVGNYRVKVIAFCFRGWNTECIPIEIPGLGPLSSSFVAYFDILPFHPTNYIYHYSAKVLFGVEALHFYNTLRYEWGLSW